MMTDADEVKALTQLERAQLIDELVRIDLNAGAPYLSYILYVGFKGYSNMSDADLLKLKEKSK
jgi:hypothetical protein